MLVVTIAKTGVDKGRVLRTTTSSLAASLNRTSILPRLVDHFLVEQSKIILTFNPLQLTD